MAIGAEAQCVRAATTDDAGTIKIRLTGENKEVVGKSSHSSDERVVVCAGGNGVTGYARTSIHPHFLGGSGDIDRVATFATANK